MPTSTRAGAVGERNPSLAVERGKGESEEKKRTEQRGSGAGEGVARDADTRTALRDGYTHAPTTARAGARINNNNNTRRRKRTSQHQIKTAVDFQLLTQNLQGFAKQHSRILQWFDGFRRLHENKPFDAVLVQETRATQRWARQLEDRYARAWGYDPQKLPAPLSYWTTTPTAAAGVAILLHPESGFRNATPLWEEHWNAHFMALQGEVAGQLATLVCVYGPTDTAAREKVFTDMAALGRPRGTVYVGGDFNCTLDPELDRSRQSKSTHYSPALRKLLEDWRIVDGLSAEMLEADSAQAVTEFRVRHHTHTYGLADGRFATSRLDRWYVTRSGYTQVTSVTVTPPVCHSDHDAVILQIRMAKTRAMAKARREGLRYPLPIGAADAMHECGRELLEQYGAELETLDAELAAIQWDELKIKIRQETLRVQRTRQAAATLRYRTRMRRLNAALRNAKAAAQRVGSTQGQTMTAITADMEALTLDAHARVKSIRQELILVKMRGTTRRTRARYASYAGAATVTARAFYKRLSIKFARRGKVELPPEPGTQATDADRLARDWRSIVQQAPCDESKQDTLFASLPARTRSLDYGAMAEPITEEEVAAAIKSCPRGKASGPDGMPNDWYRALSQLLAEVLAPLFSKWYAAGVLPPSFQGATIFCIPKTARPLTGLDYRPIALLNSDYKIYARVLLNRVRMYVTDLVSPTQFGFVPGRQVHDAVDVWTAIQARVAQGTAPAATAAILLDFAKAYDTLDRRFLRLALTRHGFPMAFVTAVDSMHLATTAKYLADGHLSETQSITTGIRQGCPLAPTLFILAVDVLYEMVAAAPNIRGVDLGGQTKVTLVGFADDTTGYVTTAEEAHALKEVLVHFAEAAGLRVNIHKSRAVYAHQLGRPPEAGDLGFPHTQPAEVFRYLGAMIASSPHAGHVWDIALKQLTARLHLAAIKTTNVLQRIQRQGQSVDERGGSFSANKCWRPASTVRETGAAATERENGAALDGRRLSGGASRWTAAAAGAAN